MKINKTCFNFVENRDFSFAVMVLFIKKNNDYSLLFELRSAGINQAGEVCFPGGKKENNESAIETALRETREELGISNIDVWGLLPFEHDLKGRIIQPVIGIIDDKDLKIEIDSAEVDHYFTCPLTFLLNNNPVKIKNIEDDYPALKKLFNNYHLYENFNDFCWLYENEAIWGLTGRIVRSLLGLIRNEK